MAQYPDRFIPKRSAMDIDYSCYLLNQKGPKPIIVESTDSEVVNSAKRSQNQNNYISVLTFSRSDLLPLRLKKAIFGNNRQKWVLQFSSRPLRKRDSPESFRCLSDVWPVKPRSKPLLKNPSIILDLPDIQDHLDCSSPLDWAATGYIATVYENEVHFWHPEGRRMEATYTSMRVGKCLKWNRQGNLLAFALEYPHCKYATWSIQLQKVKTVFFCSYAFCEITAIEWTKSNEIITGCSQGCLRTGKISTGHMMYPHVQLDGTISCVKLSSNENFCAVVVKNNFLIRLLRYPQWTAHYDINCQEIGKKISISWHPWREGLLAVGQAQGVSIWNVNNLTVVGHIVCYSIDAIAFNPVSAELLIILRECI
ncbi:unnamed protein product [Acanthoscelides obtectus]|uniref:Uncharacterized protein n=1 Tax=Acanthoscelides obtectus TaxID=200917 RepID=A0A9P0LSU2_ACAOB|nr:unnamed protein product [Acanthoscelides obtectus]CAK1646917.1 Protein cortex [Acanthoscelides obtectus]